MVATRLAFVAATCLAVLSTVEASPSYSLLKRANMPENRPYAPDLYSRAALASDEVEKRSVEGHRPYAPDLYSRSLLADDEEESDFALRSRLEYGQVYLSSKEASRAASCGFDQFYNKANAACEYKLSNKAACLGDNECESGFCGPKSKCAAKKAIGSRCNGLHAACESYYCSATQDVCKARSAEGDNCVITAGCQEGLSCINAKCHQLRASPTKRSLGEGESEVSKRTFIPPPIGSSVIRIADLLPRTEDAAPTKRRSEEGEGEVSKRTVIPAPIGSSVIRIADLLPRTEDAAPTKRGLNEEQPTKRSPIVKGSDRRRAVDLEKRSSSPSKRAASAPRSLPSGGWKRQIDLSPL